MTFFLTLHTGYNNLFVALSEKETIISHKTIENRLASKNLILTIDQILKENKIGLHDLEFICVTQGPAPLTSLRTTIATANGISFTTNLPLVGVNGLKPLMQQYYDKDFDLNIVLLNAFAGDVYFLISEKNNITAGCENIEKFMSRLNKTSKIKIFGNTFNLHKELFKTFGNITFVETDSASIENVTQLGYKNWIEKIHITNQIAPLYLK